MIRRRQIEQHHCALCTGPPGSPPTDAGFTPGVAAGQMRSFRGSRMGFAYCDFTRRDITLPRHPSRAVSAAAALQSLQSRNARWQLARPPSGAQFEFTMAAIAQNLRRLAKLVVRPPPVTEMCFA
jgi:hypothetical protein